MHGSAEKVRHAPVIWLAGPLPPPLHGQAVFNAAMAERLRERGELRVLATGERFWGKLAGYGRLLTAALFRMRRADVVYLSMPGQSAVWLFAAAILALRLRGIRHFVHHHSFRPIVAGPRRVVRLVVAFGGTLQHHILLSAGMRDRFAAMYLSPTGARRAHALSNAWLFCSAAIAPTPRSPRPGTLGHLSVLTREKGVDTLLRLFARAAARDPLLRLVIAGPVADAALSDEIEAAMAARPGRIEYRGAIEGEAKRAFWADIDLSVLPTRLVDEAEPLVMLESYAAGVDFLGSDRGCIPERLRRPDRLLTGSDEVDADRLLTASRESAADWTALRAACVQHAATLRATAEAEAHDLFGHMLSAVDGDALPRLRDGLREDTAALFQRDFRP